MVAKLKVFVSSDGFTDHVVAASSRAKALAAWGAHQDLFKTGGARETSEPDLVTAAIAHPGEVLRRPVDAHELPKLARRLAPARPKGLSKSDLARVAKAQARLAEIRAEQAEAEARFETARAKLEGEREPEVRRLETASAAAERALAKAKTRIAP